MGSKYSDRDIVVDEYEKLGEDDFVHRYSPDEHILYELKVAIRAKYNHCSNVKKLEKALQ